MERNRLSISLYFGIASALLIGGGIIGGMYFWAGNTYLAVGLILAGVLCGSTLGVIACLWVILEYRKNRKTELPATLPNQGYQDNLDDAPPVVTPPMIGAAPARTHTTISAQSPAPTSRRTGGILAAILGGSSCAILAVVLFLILLALIIIGVAIYYWGTGSWAA